MVRALRSGRTFIRSTTHETYKKVAIKKETVIKQEAVVLETTDNCKVEENPFAKYTHKEAVPEKQSKKTKPAWTRENWKETIDIITEMRKHKVAAVDTMGCGTYGVVKLPDHENRFRILISAMLSSQTKDEVNAATMNRLDNVLGIQPATLLSISEKELAGILHPISFYQNKAKYIQNTCRTLLENAKGKDIVDIPSSYKELVALSGIGPKMAHLIMTCAWNKTEGICVDIHVHRIANRFQWVNTWSKKNAKSQHTEKTRKELEDWLPESYWASINPLLVGFGQTICSAQRPKCEECQLQRNCPASSYEKLK